MSHVSRIDESYLAYRWVMSHTKWLYRHESDMTMRSFLVRHDSSICETWLIYTVRHDSSTIRETWLIYTWDMTHFYVRHDLFTCETWLIHTLDMTHLYVRHDSSTREIWLVCKWDMTHALVCLDSFIRVTWLIHVCVTWLVHMCDT